MNWSGNSFNVNKYKYSIFMLQGVWRLLTCRYSKRSGEMSVMLCVSLEHVLSDVWKEVESKLVSAMSSLRRYSNVDDEIAPHTVHLGDGLTPLITGFCLQVLN